MAVIAQHSQEGTKASQSYAAIRLKISERFTPSKSRSFYNMLNSLLSEGYHLPEL
jgi:hypothetical protein